ncbi:MAG: hypothetical protein EOP05_01480 [Proteobacteria bacterium]|nr:MAG: hypothetical protein EOP05_01480 [Pseudomonadota bacterium]
MKNRIQVLQGSLLALTAVLVVSGSVAIAASEETVKGTVTRYLTNPEGDVDGLLLNNGTQIHFPPHMSSQLTELVKMNDAVSIKGEKENSHVFHAMTVTNDKSGKSVTEAPPKMDGVAGKGRPPGPPPGGPGRDKMKRENLEAMTATGKIETELYGRRDEVNGVILSDKTIVRFGPRVSENSKVKTSVGSNLKATGYGTKNDFGKTIEATELSN